MKINFTIIFVLFLGFAQAQNFTFEPTSTLVKTITISDISDLNIDIIKTENIDTLWLEYELVSNTLPEEWYAGYCDNHGCWGTLPESGYMSPMFEDLNSYIRLSINPEGWDGSGMVEYYVYEIGHYEEGMLMTFIVDTPGFVGFHEIRKNEISLQPNPFAEQINIYSFNTIEEINIYDIMGRQIEKLNTGYQNTILINSNNWPKGLYLVEIKDIHGHSIINKVTKK